MKMFICNENENKWRLPVMIGYFFAFFSLGLVGTIWGPTLTRLSEATSSTTAQISSFFLFLGGGYVFGSLILSRLFDRFPGNVVIAIGLFTISASLNIVGHINQLWLLCLIAVVVGIGNSLIDTGGNTISAWLMKDRIKPYFNAMHVFYSVGSVLTPFFVGNSLKVTDNIGQILMTVSLVILPVAIVLCLMPSPQIPTFSKKTSAENEKKPLRGNGQMGFLVLFGIYFFLMIGSYGAISNWISSVLIQTGKTVESTAAYFTSFFWGGVFFGRFLGTFISEKFSPFKLVMASLFIAVAGAVSLNVFGGILWMIGISIFIIGFAAGPLYANSMMFMKEKIEFSGKLVGFCLACSQLGSMLVPWLIGQMLTTIGYPAFSIMIFICLLLSTLLIFVSERMYPSKTAPVPVQ